MISGDHFPVGLEETVWWQWLSHARLTPEREAIIHWEAGEPPFRWRWGDLISTAEKFAHGLYINGIRPGEVCALIIRHHRNFYPVYMGVCGLGALPAVLAYPNTRLHPEKFRAGLEGMSRSSGLDWVLTERELEPVVRPLVTQSGSTIRGLQFPLEWSAEILASGASQLATDRRFPTTCLLQHSSGTTGLQKAVALSHQAVLEHIRRYGKSIGINQEDKIVSWLPFYHDMGLIAAFYLALTHGVPLVQLDAFEWVAAPVMLLETISFERGTLCWLPNFAYHHMADRIHQEDLEKLRLDSMRMFINCSEMVRAESHDRFLQRFQFLGLKREALAACYAMAETTFAVTQTPPGAAAQVISVNREELARGRAQLETTPGKARLCVSSGAPISGCEIRVVAESAEDLTEHCVGEIAVRSVSLFEGYRNNPEKTAEVFRHGWFLTGDYGFLHRGECFVVGRKKDLIIVAGKNLYPEDIEDIVSRVDGVLAGRVVAVGVDDPATGTEQVWVIAEADLNGDHQKAKTQRAIVEAVMQIDVTVGRVFLMPPRWLIKSSAGKPSRKLNRDRALTELLPVRKNDV